MNITMRKVGLACGAVFASALLTMSTATSAWGSSSALVIGGIATPSLSDIVMNQLLAGSLKNEQRVSVNWPAQAGPITGKNDLTLGASINVGKTNLTTQINSALGRLGKDANGNYIKGEKVTVVGLSAGSLVVNEVLRQMAADPNAPAKDQITFVVVADSSRQKLINDTRYNSQLDYTYRPAPETKYDVIVVTGEYDGMADFPDRWWNALAVANAIAGSIYVHVPVMFADLSKVPAKNIDVDVNSVGGSTTHYLVPTAKLPLVQMFPALAAQEAELKAKIDKAYSRNDAPVGALRSLVAAAPAVAAPAVSAPAVITPAPTTQAVAPARKAATQTTASPQAAAVGVATGKEDSADLNAKGDEAAGDDDIAATTNTSNTTNTSTDADDDETSGADDTAVRDGVDGVDGADEASDAAEDDSETTTSGSESETSTDAATPSDPSGSPE